MNKNISFQFHFTLFCERDFDVSLLSQLLQIQPSKEWVRKHDHHKPLYRNESFWKVSSSEIFDFTFDNNFKDFLNPFGEKSKIIIDSIKKHSLQCRIDVVIKLYSGNIMPGISVSDKIIFLLASWNCSIDFDIYDFRKPTSRGTEINQAPI